MISTVHMLTGAAIATVTGNPLLGSVVAVAGHFLADTMPHMDPNIKRMKLKKWLLAASVDFLLGIVLLLILFRGEVDGWVLWLVFCSVLPDIVSVGDYFFPTRWGRFYRRWHKSIQNENLTWLGILTQVVWAGVMIWVILVF